MSQYENKENVSSNADDPSIQSPDDVSKAPTAPAEADNQNVLKQVLEKLAQNPNVQPSAQDIQGQSTQAAVENSQLTQSSDNSQTKTVVENIIKQDFLKIESLMKLGAINSLQGQNLKKQVLQKAFDVIVQNEKAKQNLPPANNAAPQSKDEAFSEFDRENPNFFSTDGRKEVLDYLKSENVSVGKDDIKKISQMVESIEQNAISRYLKQSTYEKNLVDSNELAKQRLTANAQNSSFQDKNLSRSFTREQIGNMSSAEFTKYEPMIMEQLKKGLIR